VAALTDGVALPRHFSPSPSREPRGARAHLSPAFPLPFVFQLDADFVVGVSRFEIGEKEQAKVAELDLVVGGQRGRVHWLAVDVDAIEAADVDDADWPFSQRNSAWQRLTALSSRKMSLGGWRPADRGARSIMKRDPVLGRRLTTTTAERLGRHSGSNAAGRLGPQWKRARRRPPG
jgi:hypothetical protein